jgi:pimeloyl-ACP methyl ester carboxylesterase
MLFEERIDLPTGPQTVMRSRPLGLGDGDVLLWIQGDGDVPVEHNPVAAALGSGHLLISPMNGREASGQIAARCLALIETMDLRPVTVIGHSFGVSAALGLAARHGEVISRLVLISPLRSSVHDLPGPFPDDPPPSLVIAARSVDESPMTTAERARSLLPGAQVVVLSSGSSAATLDEPIDVLRALRGFLGSRIPAWALELIG